MFGDTAARLATNLNVHNELNHRNATVANWSAGSVVLSSHYIGSESKPRMEYTVPYKNHMWGNAKNPPDITQADIDMLAEEYIKW